MTGIPLQLLPVSVLCLLWGGALPAQVRINPQPTTVVAGRVGDQLQFAEAVGATRLADGRIAVADGPGGAIRLFSPRGVLVGSFGRRGRGPGEFQQLTWLGRCAGDTLAVLETFAQRITLVTATGHEVRRLQGLTPLQVACSSTGILAVLRQSREEPAEAAAFVSMHAPVVVATGNGRVLHELGEVSALEVALLDGQWTPRPLGPVTTVAAGGGRIYVGTATSPDVLVFTEQGERLSSVLVSAARRAPTAAHVDAAIAALVWPVPEGLRVPMGRKFRRIPLPKELPHYHAVFATPSGALWVQTSFPGDAGTAFEVFNASGLRVGRAVLPIDVQVFEVGDDYLVAGVEDSLGEQSVAVFSVRH